MPATWTEPPKTWSAGETLTHTDFNTYFRDNMMALKTPNQTRLAAGVTTNTTSTSFADISGVTITRVVNASKVDVMFTGSIATAAAATFFVTLLIDGVNVGDATTGITGAQFTAAGGCNFSFTYPTDVLTAASHTWKLQWKTSASTITLNTGWSFYVVER
jgi:hypothetical protein